MTTEEKKTNAVSMLQYRIDMATIEKSILVSLLEVVPQFTGKSVNARILKAINEQLLKDYGTKTVEGWGQNGESKKFAHVEAGYQKGYAIGDTQYYDITIYYQSMENLPTYPRPRDDSNENKRIDLHFSNSYEDLLQLISRTMEYREEVIGRYTKGIEQIDTIIELSQEAQEAVKKYDEAVNGISYVIDSVMKDW
jgi:hypothetical protein